MHIPANAPSLLAARDIIASAQHRDDLLGQGLADVIELQTSTLDHEQLVELIFALAAAIERLAAAPDNLLAAISNAIAPAAGRR